jgi:hypothetical protein
MQLVTSVIQGIILLDITEENTFFVPLFDTPSAFHSPGWWLAL